MGRFLRYLFLCIFLTSCRDMVEQEADEKFALAEAALQEGEWARADESFHETILLDPDRADAWVGRGMTLTRLGEEESARVHYEEALRIYQDRSTSTAPDDELPFESIRRQIMLLVLLDRWDEAAALAEQTAANHPDEPSIQTLPALAEKIRREFEDMILSPDEQEDETAPILSATEPTAP